MTRRSLVIVVGTVVVVLCAVVFYLVGPARCGSAQTWTIEHGCYPGADAR
jgi:hypothetical protein